ncbi:MAG: TIGR04282 family arsenosugar biosynthesis glycosyltransferase [Bosea sp. (in: a-proteobacteria)]
MAEPVTIAIFAKAPIAGFAKTRLIPALGAEGAARLAERLIRRIATEALAAKIGAVTLWCAPDAQHALFQELAASADIALRTQQGADIGDRMAAAFAAMPNPLILVGADCPSIDAARLRQAMNDLSQADLVLDPAEDGGYGLIAGRGLPAALFEGVAWSTPVVAQETRQRAGQLGLKLHEGPLLRDLDTPDDLAWWQGRMPELFT